jgi:aerobic carbon-monoxide dehydrogenase small subunit
MTTDRVTTDRVTTETKVELSINGRRHVVGVEPRHTLGDVLREQLGLTGTHLGCEHGVCGACTVLVDGEPTRSCLVFAVQMDQTEITTIEGLAAADGTLHPVQEAFSACHGLQCGFCTPGFVLTAVHLLATNPAPDRATIRRELSGNLCRCTGYVGIISAVERAAVERAAVERAAVERAAVERAVTNAAAVAASAADEPSSPRH